jgi:hypothetical protein
VIRKEDSLKPQRYQRAIVPNIAGNVSKSKPDDCGEGGMSLIGRSNSEAILQKQGKFSSNRMKNRFCK